MKRVKARRPKSNEGTHFRGLDEDGQVIPACGPGVGGKLPPPDYSYDPTCYKCSKYGRRPTNYIYTRRMRYEDANPANYN